jgi:hypothetical protein
MLIVRFYAPWKSACGGSFREVGSVDILALIVAFFSIVMGGSAYLFRSGYSAGGYYTSQVQRSSRLEPDRNQHFSFNANVLQRGRRSSMESHRMLSEAEQCPRWRAVIFRFGI